MTQQKLTAQADEILYPYSSGTDEDLRPRMKTGDLVLFAGTTPGSMAIRLGTRSRWSHVGMVLKLEEFDEIMLWESTTLKDLRDEVTKTYKVGVQMVPLSARVGAYPGDVSWRPLRLDDETGRKQLRAKLAELRGEWKNKRYEKDLWELMQAAYDGPFGGNEEDLSMLFCSELVAEAYQRCGLLPEVDQGGLPSNEYTPRDFSAARRLGLNHARLGAEHLFKRYAPAQQRAA